MSKKTAWRETAILEIPTEDRVSRTQEESPELELVLTIVAHPDMSRAGEIARASTAKAAKLLLSRASPDFAQPDSNDAFPLADPLLSRRVITFERESDGTLSIARAPGAASLEIDGRNIEEGTRVGAGELARGMILLFGKRVCLHLALREVGTQVEKTLGLVGQSTAMSALRRQILDASAIDACVLIRGETGSGKDLVARSLHQESARRDKPFVSVNIAAVPGTLAASELFGHARGAFTGAESAREGHFVRADGGTLFLDEIGEAPPEVQVMLLRTLETGVVQRLGDGLERRLDVRLVTATDADLDALAERHQFRPALLHRLKGYEIFVPTLAERREDLGRLLYFMLREELERLGAASLLEARAPAEEPWLGAEVVDRLARYDWPGNVRQLRNVARFIAVAFREDTVRWTSSLARMIDRGEHAAQKEQNEAPGEAEKARRKPAEISISELTAALAAHGWRIRPAAVALGLSRASLYMLVERYPQLREARDIPDEELERCWREAGEQLDRASSMLGVSMEVLHLRVFGRARDTE